MTETIFTVEAPSSLYVKVSWTDAEGRACWFFAEHDGDQLTKVRNNGHGKTPSVMRLEPDAFRGRATILDAGAPSFVPVVMNAVRYVRKHKLATQAQAERARIRAEKDAQLVADKAATVIRLLSQNGLKVRDIENQTNVGLAKLYDDIQNACV